MFQKIKLLLICLFAPIYLVKAQTDVNTDFTQSFQIPNSCKAQNIGNKLNVFSCGQSALYDLLNQNDTQLSPTHQLLKKATAFTLLSDLPNALGALDSLLNIDSTALQALQLKALVCEQLEEHQSALESIYNAIAIKPELAEVLWIEIQVLRNKMALSKNPAYNLNGSLISLDFGSHDLPKSEYAMPYLQLLNQLMSYAQIRFTFYSADTLSNALILFDIGNLNALASSVNDALTWYQLARTYRFESYLLEARIKKIENLTEAKKQLKANELDSREVKTEQNSTTLYLIAAVIAAIIVAILALVMRKKNKNKITSANG